MSPKNSFFLITDLCLTEDGVGLIPPGVPFLDDEYNRKSWSGHPKFEYLQDEQGGSDEESDADAMGFEPPPIEEDHLADLEEQQIEAEEAELALISELDAGFDAAVAAAAPEEPFDEEAFDAAANAEPEESSSSSSSSSSS